MSYCYCLIDPCTHVKCGYGEICVVDGHKGRCFCPPRCLNHRIQRVCGTDGITYKSYCDLMRTACIIGDKTLKKEHDGRCGSRPTTESSTLSTPETQLPSSGNMLFYFILHVRLSFKLVLQTMRSSKMVSF